MIKAIVPECKDPKQKIEFFGDRPFNDVRYYLNFDKLCKLGWKPEVGRTPTAPTRPTTMPHPARHVRAPHAHNTPRSTSCV